MNRQSYYWISSMKTYVETTSKDAIFNVQLRAQQQQHRSSESWPTQRKWFPLNSRSSLDRHWIVTIVEIEQVSISTTATILIVTIVTSRKIDVSIWSSGSSHTFSATATILTIIWKPGLKHWWHKEATHWILFEYTDHCATCTNKFPCRVYLHNTSDVEGLKRHFASNLNLHNKTCSAETLFKT